jgi:glutamyl-tRNA reductase
MEICVTGLNHKRAPVELREKLAVDGAALGPTLAALQKGLGAREMVILSTCNRVEVYAVHEGEPPGVREVAAALGARHGVAPEALVPALYRHQGAEAVRHLFRVASSLDSMVVGETQIIGQVKDAYFAAKEAGATGPVFNRLFQHALYVAKRVHSTTALGERQVSVPSVAARMAEKVFQDLASKTLVVVGAGETGDLTVAAFRNRGVSRIHVVNRTPEHARALAERTGGRAHALEDLPRVLPLGDVVLACLRFEGYAIGPAEVRAAMQARRQEPMFFIDIAVPRTIDPAVNEIENVYLFNIDDLESIVRQNLEEREREVVRCLPLVEAETQVFLKEITPPDVTALLAHVRERFQAIADEELRRTLGRLNGLSEGQKQEISELARRIINKVLHAPSEALRGGGLSGAQHTIVELVRKLFGLNKKDSGHS